jgi:hypothetical protein
LRSSRGPPFGEASSRSTALRWRFARSFLRVMELIIVGWAVAFNFRANHNFLKAHIIQ